ncbi:hypothetical protein ACIQXA_03300 [Streptomyces massasporeus]|uniref:hypothetical protein n=1 Tax=Streptomyces massasporeus TaxID=67324 RepID=UPI0038055AB0
MSTQSLFDAQQDAAGALADDLRTRPVRAPGLPAHPHRLQRGHPLRVREICEALGHGLPPKNIKGTRAKLKRLVKLDVLSEVDAGGFARKQ